MQRRNLVCVFILEEGLVHYLEVKGVSERRMDCVDAERLLHNAHLFVLGLQNALAVLLALNEVLNKQLAKLLDLVDLLFVLLLSSLEVINSCIQIGEHTLAVVEHAPALAQVHLLHLLILHQILILFGKCTLHVARDLLQRSQHLDLDHQHCESEDESDRAYGYVDGSPLPDVKLEVKVTLKVV